MNVLAVISVFFFGVATAFSNSNIPSTKNIALVYSGIGTCEENCPQAAAEAAIRAGLHVRYVTLETLTPEIFRDAVLWIQPGGDAIEVAKRLSPAQRMLIRRFVGSGGGYVGFCAGGYLADHTVDDANTIPGLGLFPGTTRDYGVPKQEVVIPLLWSGRIHYLYFQDGGYFDIPSGSPVHVIAKFPEGYAATIAVGFGRGRVVVSGAHPEAPRAWIEDAHLDDPDGSDFDLATDMIYRAIGRRAL